MDIKKFLKNYHPLLLSLFFVLFTYKYNLPELPISKVPIFLSFLLISLIGVAIIYFLTIILSKNNRKSAVVATLFVLLFFNYGRLLQFIRRPPHINPFYWIALVGFILIFFIWLAYKLINKNSCKYKKAVLIIISTSFVIILALTLFKKISFQLIIDIFKYIQTTLGQEIIFFISSSIFFVIALVIIFKMHNTFDSTNRYLNLLSVILVIMILLQICLYFILSGGNCFNAEEKKLLNDSFDQQLINNEQNKSFPDIYYIILDGYTSNEILKETFSYNNDLFTEELKKRGFFIASNSHSNYINSFLSISSSFNYDYINFLSEDPGKKSMDRTIAYQLLEFNKVVKHLKSNGYQYIHLSSSWEGTNDNRLADQVFSPYTTDETTDELGSFLLHSTPLRIFAPNEAYVYTMYSFSKLEEIPKMIEGRKFVFAHIMNPHPPFVIDNVGNEIPTDYHFEFLTDWSNKEGYVNQVEYANKRVLTIIDSIILNSDSSPIIIIQGDHGTETVSGWINNPNKQRIDERFSILNAYYFPNLKNKETFSGVLYPSISPVNTFRVIFNEYFNQEYPLLDDITYFSKYDTPYDFEEVFKNGTYTGRYSSNEDGWVS